MRLRKMIFWGSVIYGIYQWIQSRKQGRRTGREFFPLGRALNRDRGRMNVASAGRGERIRTEDASGASVPHTVGRGVVHRP